MVTERKGSTTTKQITLAGCVGAAPPPGIEQLPCPRCHSTNTKFCYYNNYNFSQPRHFCKNCRRYWTHGGTLRDIPVGGGTRKNAKRSRTMSSATAATSAETTTMHSTPTARTNELAGMTFGSNTQLGSFTSLLSDGCTNGLLGLGFGGFGFGLGVGDVGFLGGLGTRSSGVCNFPDTWQVESAGEAGVLDYAAVSSQGTSLLK